MAENDTRTVIDQLLDQEIASIESHREFVRQQRMQGKAELERAWLVTVAASRELKQRLMSHPRLRYFNIARDGQSVTISFDGGSDRTADVREFQLSRQHPEGKHDTTHAIWCRETHREESRLHSAEDAVRAMVRFCAVNMTTP